MILDLVTKWLTGPLIETRGTVRGNRLGCEDEEFSFQYIEFKMSMGHLGGEHSGLHGSTTRRVRISSGDVDWGTSVYRP